jgi:hypothetical protein
MAFNIQNLGLSTSTMNTGVNLSINSGNPSSSTDGYIKYGAPAIRTYYSPFDSLVDIVNNNNYFGSVASEWNIGDMIYISDATGFQTGKNFFYVDSIDVKKQQVIIKQLVSTGGTVFDWIILDNTIVEENVGGVYQLQSNMGYLITATPQSPVPDPEVPILTCLLPTSINAGEQISFSNQSGAIVRISQNAGQQISIGTDATGLGVYGYVMTDITNQSFDLICIGNNWLFSMSNIVGSPQYF